MKIPIRASLCGIGLLMLWSTIARAENPRFNVAVYLPDYRFSGFTPDDAKGVDELILFSAIPRADATLALGGLENAPYPKLKRWKEQERGRLILALGGWGRSDGFAAVASEPEKCKKLAAAVLETCQSKGFDGIDLDWEHPKDQQAARDYVRLMTALRDVLGPKGMTISVTVAGWQPLTDQTHRTVDCVQLMAYDHKDRHSTFEGAIDEVNALVKKGIPKSKIRLGLPLYGRGIKEPGKTLSYSDIVTKYHPVPSVDEMDGVYFNGPETMRRKVRYAKDAGLAGVMLWEAGQDARGPGSLVRLIVDEAKK